MRIQIVYSEYIITVYSSGKVDVHKNSVLVASLVDVQLARALVEKIVENCNEPIDVRIYPYKK